MNIPARILATSTLLLLLSGACAPAQQMTVKKTFLHPVNGYSQVVAVRQNRITTLYVSGQVGVGATREAQLRNAWENLRNELRAAGAEYKDLVKVNTYIVDYQESDLAVFRQVRQEMLAMEQWPASTLVGVAALGRPEWKVEIEAVAVVQQR